MQRMLLIALIATCSFATVCFGQSASSDKQLTVSLCTLQKEVAEGSHKTVVVSGVFNEGLDRGTLDDANCPKEATWVELALRSQRNKGKLRKLLQHSHRAYVVLEGEFYGPPLADRKLPEAIRKQYRPGWGHLAAFRTKLVVRIIRNVEVAPVIHGAETSALHESQLLYILAVVARP